MDTLIDLHADAAFMQAHEKVKGLTVTSIERQYALVEACRYLAFNGIEGDFVELGVYRGGSVLLAEAAFAESGDTRRFWLYDSFAGLPEHGEHDKAVAGVGPEHFVGELVATVEEVSTNLRVLRPECQCVFVKGDIRETLLVEENLPKRIAFLHCDSDWHDSTKVELEVLYPRVVSGGVVLIDDFGQWLGQKKAVNDYFADKPKPLMHRMDYSGRAWVKP